MITWEEFKTRIHARWRLGDLSPIDQLILVWIFMAQAMFRGIDYLRYDEIARIRQYDILYADYDHFFLGVLFVSASVIFLLGAIFRKHAFIWLAHSLLALLYLNLLIAVIAFQIQEHVLILRSHGVFLIAFMFHTLFMLRTGIKPLSDSESVLSDEQTIVRRED